MQNGVVTTLRSGSVKTVESTRISAFKPSDTRTDTGDYFSLLSTSLLDFLTRQSDTAKTGTSWTLFLQIELARSQPQTTH
jgi:hypothetical protein